MPTGDWLVRRIDTRLRVSGDGSLKEDLPFRLCERCCLLVLLFETFCLLTSFLVYLARGHLSELRVFL